jgi:ribonuclease P protein component
MASYTGYRLPKARLLRGNKRIATLFESGDSGFVYPFRYVCRTTESGAGDVALLAAVSKKNHKRAVVRNLYKRRTREAFRLHCNQLRVKAAERGVQIDLALMYATKDLVDYKTMEDAVEKIIAKLVEDL